MSKFNKDRVVQFNEIVDTSKFSANALKRIQQKSKVCNTGVVGKPSIADTFSYKKPAMIVNVDDKQHYIRTLVPLAPKQKIDLLEADADKVDGIQSFKGDVLENIGAHMIYALKISYNHAATDDKVAEIVYDQDFPVFLRNSEFVIRQESKEIFRMPMNVFDTRTVGNTVNDKFYYLDKPVVLYGDTAFEMQIECPKFGTLPADKTYLEVLMQGMQA